MWQLKDNLFKETDFPFFHLTTTKIYGNMRDPVVRKKFCDGAGIDFDRLVTLEQTHSSQVEIVNNTHAGKLIPVADGLITITKDLPIAMFSADCLPVFIACKEKMIAAIVHAGWQGVKKEIVPAAVRMIKEKFRIDPSEIFAAIGPHIQEDCFKIEDDLRGMFNLKKNETHLNLSKIVTRQLNSEGVTRISICEACTCHEPDILFSFRRDKTVNRMMSVVRI